MEHVLYPVIQNVLDMVDAQAVAITRLTEAQIKLTTQQEDYHLKTEQMLEYYTYLTEMQQKISEGQQKIILQLQHILEQISRQEAKHTALEDNLYALLDVFNNDLMQLKQRLATLEASNQP